MLLFTALKQDRMKARRTHETLVSNILTVLLGELETNAKRDGTEVTDDMVIKTATKFIKSNNETMQLTESSSTTVTLKAENSVLNNYLPKQLTESELRVIITDINASNIGVVMKELKMNYPGQYDGRMASIIAKEIV